MAMTKAEARKLVARLNVSDRMDDRSYDWRVGKIGEVTVQLYNGLRERTFNQEYLRELYGDDTEYAYDTPFTTAIEESTAEKGMYFARAYMTRGLPDVKRTYESMWGGWFFQSRAEAQAFLDSGAWKVYCMDYLERREHNALLVTQARWRNIQYEQEQADAHQSA
jgi:hypothetical protein